LFADIVGFTTISAKMRPEDVVHMLNDLISDFDKACAECGVEKIKTIGDAYMAVAGLPERAPDHAERVVKFAIRMFESVKAYNEAHGTDLNIRVGINSGPVVAGVIGTSKFIYDLWGDAVNTASRMESHGVPGRIHISKSTESEVAGRFEIERRGEITVKGKGSMETYFVAGSHELVVPA
jgi:class 3 adenylate cyclase